MNILYFRRATSSLETRLSATLDLSGNSTFTVNYDGLNPVTINDVFLVK
jgi:hypothetical protein